MSIDYALVHDETGEAYDLGRGPWYEWSESFPHTFDESAGFPKRREDVLALLAYWQEGWALGLQPRWASALAEDIWRFIECHPGCRLTSDLSDEEWHPGCRLTSDLSDEEWHPLSPSAIGHPIDDAFVEIGSRYDLEVLLERSPPEVR